MPGCCARCRGGIRSVAPVVARVLLGLLVVVTPIAVVECVGLADEGVRLDGDDFYGRLLIGLLIHDGWDLLDDDFLCLAVGVLHDVHALTDLAEGLALEVVDADDLVGGEDRLDGCGVAAADADAQCAGLAAGGAGEPGAEGCYLHGVVTDAPAAVVGDEVAVGTGEVGCAEGAGEGEAACCRAVGRCGCQGCIGGVEGEGVAVARQLVFLDAEEHGGAGSDGGGALRERDALVADCAHLIEAVGLGVVGREGERYGERAPLAGDAGAGVGGSGGGDGLVGGEAEGLLVGEDEAGAGAVDHYIVGGGEGGTGGSEEEDVAVPCGALRGGDEVIRQVGEVDRDE